MDKAKSEIFRVEKNYYLLIVEASKYFTQAIYPWIFQFPHIFIQKSKYIHYDLRIFFTHFNAVKRPQNFSKILPCHHHNTNKMQIIILSNYKKS